MSVEGYYTERCEICSRATLSHVVCSDHWKALEELVEAAERLSRLLDLNLDPECNAMAEADIQLKAALKAAKGES